MSVLEIVSGVMLMLASLIIIYVVLTQEPKGQGLSGVIAGGSDMMSGESRARSKDARQAKMTRVMAIVFFVLTILVNAFSILAG